MQIAFLPNTKLKLLFNVIWVSDKKTTHLNIYIFPLSKNPDPVKLPIGQAGGYRGENVRPPLLIELVPDLQTP